MSGSQQQIGATLLELMLVIAISALLLAFGLKMYRIYQMTWQIQQLRYNVDQLFQATRDYFRAQCAQGDLAPQPANFLSPYARNSQGMAYPPQAAHPLAIATTLLEQGYLSHWQPANPLVDASGGEDGYVVQFNPQIFSAIPVNACVVVASGSACHFSPELTTPPLAAIPASQAAAVYWIMQVAVKINKSSDMAAYLPALGADCVSGESSDSSSLTVESCPSSNETQDYLVWTRAPSAALHKNSIFSGMLSVLRQMNLQYTHDQNNEFNAGYSTSNPKQAPVYYLCGG